MAVGKASIKRAASAGTVAKPAKKTTVKKSAEVKDAVLTPMNSEEIQVKFMTGGKKTPKDGAPVKITDEMPVHLL